jgi:hypothetical protein
MLIAYSFAMVGNYISDTVVSIEAFNTPSHAFRTMVQHFFDVDFR